MNKILCIVGSTGTGKTARAIEISKQQPSILISADSRQVYRGMDIVTGKDHPSGLDIYGIDIVDPDESSSVSVWHNSVMPHISRAWEVGQLPIIVGGTGLYVKALTSGIATLNVPINQELRDELLPLSVIELQQKLLKLNQEKFNTMNNSDSHNTRRLIRAIEVSMHNNSKTGQTIESQFILPESKIIGLNYSNDKKYSSKVRQRVIDRLEQGAVDETKQLLSKYDKNIASMSAIGYKSIIKFLENLCTEEEMIEEWVEGELSYAKRQMTWFRKQPVIWYDVDTYGSKKN